MKSLPIQPTIVFACLLLFASCQTANDNKNTAIKAATDYQSVIDSKIEEIRARQGQIKEEIINQNQASQDTFQLAKSLVPLNTATFLLETQYDEITTSIEGLNDEKVPVDSLWATIKRSKLQVETILNDNQIWE